MSEAPTVFEQYAAERLANDGAVSAKDLYRDFITWCRANGRDRWPSRAMFAGLVVEWGGEMAMIDGDAYFKNVHLNY